MAHSIRSTWLKLAVILCCATAAVAQTRSSTRPTTRAISTRPVPSLGRATTLPSSLLKASLDSLEDLRALQKQVRDVAAKVSPTVVGLRVGGGQGSGVIITEDGYVLTAAHVSGTPDRPVTILLHDGKQASGKTLGAYNSMDAGLIQITDKGPLPAGKWPAAPLGSSSTLKAGQWCIAMGHPGGYRANRTAPLRLGRILDLRANAVKTDCTLVGGDSGGPLFDLHGRVIGIHSRIGGTLADNLHVPVDIYRAGWTRLASAEEWGEAFWRNRRGAGSYLGVQVNPETEQCLIDEVYANSPAQRAGLKAGDVVKVFDDIPIANSRELEAMLRLRKPNQQINIIVDRGGARVTLKVTLGKRPDEDQ